MTGLLTALPTMPPCAQHQIAPHPPYLFYLRCVVHIS